MIWNKIVCLFIGHDDPFYDFIGLCPEDELVELMTYNQRQCRRCGTDLVPIKP